MVLFITIRSLLQAPLLLYTIMLLVHATYFSYATYFMTPLTFFHVMYKYHSHKTWLYVVIVIQDSNNMSQYMYCIVFIH